MSNETSTVADIKRDALFLSKFMSEKGLVNPRLDFWFKHEQLITVYMSWSGNTKTNEFSLYSDAYNWAFTLISELPSPEEQRREEFLRALSTAIELGKAVDLDMGADAPPDNVFATTLSFLKSSMLRLSKNALFAPKKTKSAEERE